MKPLRCLIGLHRGRVLPAHEVDADVPGHVAFVCSRCGDVVDTTTPAGHPADQGGTDE